ncbi:unnamed protein product [Cyprideis torosa]|uniref:mitogen-activated protein kinase kinase n=1 Tax=Cyprideis torosa TaxID=163714 RepID=A0A7R8WGW6_9CRUS|nr:unnamed protein product [Cyprideis torosa]CAG0893108.1 unnamed protein product [Cyprideis torosa]
MTGRKKFQGPGFKIQQSTPPPPVAPPRDLDKTTTITINGEKFECDADDLEPLELLGRGAYGVVERMKHRPSGTVMAVKIVSALEYLHRELKVIHRDVKPSNVLINRKGEVKICDFGISGYLVDSVAKTIDAGCKPYMAPERIDPSGNPSCYDVKSDVWSLGISLVELATGTFPYSTWTNPFEQLKQVVQDDPPRLPEEFSDEIRDFVAKCLNKTVTERPTYPMLLQHPFLNGVEQRSTDVVAFVDEILSLPAPPSQANNAL